MRITIPVSGDGDAWMSHMPEIKFDPKNLLDGNGRLVLPKVVALFKEANEFHERQFGRQMFMMGDGDGFNTLSMTVEFLRQLAAVTHWIENRPGAKAHVSSDGSKQDQRLERRMAKDQVAFCRIDVREVATGVKFVIGYGNPQERVIGNCENGAREFAIYATRIILAMADDVNKLSREKNAGLKVTVEGRDPDLVEDAKRREIDGKEKDAIREANEKRCDCPYRMADYCSPPQFGCRCYKDGRCVEAVFTGKENQK